MITFEQLLLEVSIDQLRRDWVDAGKMQATTFDFICQCANNQSAYATWFVKRIGDSEQYLELFDRVATTPDETFKQQTLEQWQDSFNTFTKYKQYFERKDINQYRAILDWVQACVRAREQAEAKKRLKDIDRFKIGTVEANGKGYLVYKLPKGHPENRQISVELGRHAPGVSGWCTAYDGETRYNYWEDHIAREDLYIFINPADRLNDKFQIQFGYSNDKPFPVKTDSPMNDIQVAPYLPFYDFLHEKENRPLPRFVQKARALQAAIANPTGQLEEYETGIAGGGVYKFADISADNAASWIRPLTEVLGLSSDQYGEVAQVGMYRSRDQYFISTTADGESGPFKAFTVRWNRRHRQSELYPYCDMYANGAQAVKEAMDQSTSLELELKENEVFFNRVRELAAALDVPMYRQLQVFFHSLLHPRVPRVRAARAQAAANGANTNREAQVTEALQDKFLKSEGSAKFYEIEPEDAHVFFDGLENMQSEEQHLRNHLEGTVGVVIQKGIALLISDLHRGEEYEDADIDHIYRTLITRLDLSTGLAMANRMNPDALFKIYAAFSNSDNDVTYPPMIAKIQAIHDGALSDYELDWHPANVTALYKVPTVQAQELIPYSLPQLMQPSGYVILGYISKWQFTLSNLGYFMLTGRWGSNGTKSWIDSVPGLAQAIIAICDRYNIPRAGALRQLQEICDQHNIPYPKELKEALLEDSRKDLAECNQTCKDLWLDTILG